MKQSEQMKTHFALPCHPPPDPPSHSPSNARRLIFRRLASDSMGPVVSLIWPVARMSTAMQEHKSDVETANREPTRISSTRVTSSNPCSIRALGSDSFHGGTIPLAITAALRRPNSSRAKSNNSPTVPISAVLFKSSDRKTMQGRSRRRRNTSTGARGVPATLKLTLHAHL